MDPEDAGSRMPKLSAISTARDRCRSAAVGVSERELEEAERAEIEGNGDRLHSTLQARLDRDAGPLDVAEVRVDERAHRGRAAEALPDLFGELEALLGVA